MKSGAAIAVAAAILVSGCDDATVISHVDKMPNMKLDDLWTMQDGRGIPVEIHGQPFRTGSDLTLAEALRPPAGVAEGVKFYSAPVGTWKGGHAWRLVLHFNPRGGPNAYEDCKRDAEAVTNELPAEGYSVNVSFCKADEWQAHGFLKVLKGDGSDTQAYSDAMATLMSAIFQDDPGDQR